MRSNFSSLSILSAAVVVVAVVSSWVLRRMASVTAAEPSSTSNRPTANKTEPAIPSWNFYCFMDRDGKIELPAAARYDLYLQPGEGLVFFRRQGSAAALEVMPEAEYRQLFGGSRGE